MKHPVMSQKDIDMLVESFVEEEKSIFPNPFLATRIMGAIGNLKEQEKFIPVWQGVVMALSFIVAIAFGIKAGNMYKSNSSHQSQTVMFVNDEEMEHFGFYRQTLNN